MSSKLKARKPAEVKPGKVKMLTFSKAGVGKTWLSMDFPNVYYIDTEGGARLGHYQDKLKTSGGAYFGVEDGSMDFATVIGQIEALATEQHGYKTLAIGSITKLYQSTIALEQVRLGEKDQFGASKKPAVSFMRRLTLWLQRVDMNVLLEAHEATEWGINPKTGMREEIGSVPDVWDKMVYELDLTLKLEKRGPSRVCIVRKSRLTGFPEGESFPCEYAAFAERYGKDFMEAVATPIHLATPEQVAEITRLREVVAIDAGKFEALLAKAGAAEIEELSTTQAEATIKWFREKIA
jgi:hypothetical protein